MSIRTRGLPVGGSLTGRRRVLRPMEAFSKKGSKSAQLQVRLLSHILASSLSAQKAASSLPSNPMPTCPCPVLTGNLSCAFLHGVCHACQRVTNAGEQESGAPRSVLAASMETSSRASKREQAPTADRCLPVGAGSLARVCFGEASSYRACQYPSAGNRSVPRRAFRPRVSLGALSRQVCGPGREHS